MEGSPDAVDVKALEDELKGLDNVAEVKETHCWSLSRGKIVFVGKIVAKGDTSAVLKKATEVV